ANRNYSAESFGRVGRSGRGRSAWVAKDDAGTARPVAHLQRHPAHDHVSPCLLAPKSGAFGKTQSLGRHASSAGATRSTNHRTTEKLFFVTAVTDRRYSFARSNMVSIWFRDARARASDQIIPRTSRRGTFTVCCNAAAPAASNREIVRAPINAGKT